MYLLSDRLEYAFDGFGMKHGHLVADRLQQHLSTIRITLVGQKWLKAALVAAVVAVV